MNNSANHLTIDNVHKIGIGAHAVVCLNGWFGHAKHWGDWQNQLNQTDFTWYFPDYRGYGSRKAVQGEFTLAEISQDITALIDQLPHDKISLIGHSMGGLFMQQVLLDSKRPIHSLVGISPVPATGTPLPPEQRALFESTAHDPASRRMIIDFTTGSKLTDVWLDNMMRVSEATTVPSAILGYFKAWADSNIFDELKTRNEPILVIVGETDVAVTEESVDNTYAKTFNNHQILTFKQCGHYAMDESPILLATEIEKFLQQP